MKKKKNDLEEHFFIFLVSLLMFEKVFQALISSDMNVNLRFSFPFWSVTCKLSSLEHSLFIYCSPKIYFEWQFSLKTFYVFSGYIEHLFTKKLWLRLLFLQKIWTERALFKIAAFLHVTSRTVWNCFSTPNFLSRIVTYIRCVKPLSLSFSISTFINSLLPFT